MSNQPIKIGELYYLIGEGIFGCALTVYKKTGSSEDSIKLERIDSGKFKVFESSIEGYAYLVDLWRSEND
jgi:hypothetical protein